MAKSKITADIKNSATKFLRQMGDAVSLAEAVVQLGNIEQNIASAETTLVTIAKEKEKDNLSLKQVKEKIKVAEKNLKATEDLYEAAKAAITKAEQANHRLSKKQIDERDAHAKVMEEIKAREVEAELKVEVALNEEVLIKARANKVKEEAAQEKAEAKGKIIVTT